jgi:vacuolar-type H+-ATPase subunit E/Vma4
MSSETVLEAQTVALLRRLAREQEMRTRRARDEADDQARDVVRRARGEARIRVHQAVLETRRELELAVARRKAAIDTRERRTRQAMLRRLLDDAWQRLPSALEQRWADRGARATWSRAACAQAARNLLHLGQVVIEIDPRWAGELDATVRGCFDGTTTTIEIAPVAGLGPGLRIRAGKACLDATVGGLVAARERIAAELLAEVDRQLTGRAGEEAA